MCCSYENSSLTRWRCDVLALILMREVVNVHILAEGTHEGIYVDVHMGYVYFC